MPAQWEVDAREIIARLDREQPRWRENGGDRTAVALDHALESLDAARFIAAVPANQRLASALRALADEKEARRNDVDALNARIARDADELLRLREYLADLDSKF